MHIFELRFLRKQLEVYRKTNGQLRKKLSINGSSQRIYAIRVAVLFIKSRSFIKSAPPQLTKSRSSRERGKMSKLNNEPRSRFAKNHRGSFAKIKNRFAKLVGVGLAIFAVTLGSLVSNQAVFAACGTANNVGFILNPNAADTEVVDYQLTYPGAKAMTHYHDINTAARRQIIDLANGTAELSIADSYDGTSGKVTGTPAGAFIFGFTDWAPDDFITMRYNNAATYNSQPVDIVATYSNVVAPRNANDPAKYPRSIEIEKRFYAGNFQIANGQMQVNFQIMQHNTNNLVSNLVNTSVIVASLSPPANQTDVNNQVGEYAKPLSGFSEVKLTANTVITETTTFNTNIIAYKGAIIPPTPLSDNVADPTFMDMAAEFIISSSNMSFITGTDATYATPTTMWSMIYFTQSQTDVDLPCPNAPVKSVNKTSIAQGETTALTFAITQPTQTIGAEIMSPYDSFVLTDKLDTRISVDLAAVKVFVGDVDRTADFAISFSDSLLTITALTTALNDAKFYGTNVVVEIPATAKSDNLTDINNVATIAINDYAAQSNIVKLRVTAPNSPDENTTNTTTPNESVLPPNSGFGLMLDFARTNSLNIAGIVFTAVAAFAVKRKLAKLCQR